MKSKILLASAIFIMTMLVTYNYEQANNTKQLFKEWKNENKIEFKTAEQDFYRMQIFIQNAHKVQTHNSDGNRNKYELEMNQFGALTFQQFASIYLLEPLAIQAIQLKVVENETKKLGADVNWVANGAVSPVENSGSMCAASYATFSVGAMESLRKITEGQLKKLSKQQILQCSGKYGNDGCSNGSPVNSYKYSVDHGISDQSQYPINSTLRACQHQYSTFKISAYAEQKSCVEVHQALTKQPVSVYIDASNWMFYRSGIFTKCDSSAYNLVALLVGMTDSYWLVKNQWGTSWGESGYIRLQMGNCCGICGKASTPLK